MKKPIKISNKARCCGCSACANICPVNAITMQADNFGFAYPEVDLKACINCGKCVTVCQYCHPWKNPEATNIPEVYAARAQDVEELLKSSSGAISHLVLRDAVTSGATAFGAVYDDQLNVIHSSARSLTELEKFRKSKYVQSDIGTTFKETKTLLEEGKSVIFTGTPCQIAGLYKFLEGIDLANLATVDLICHGVPSPAVFQQYLLEEEKKLGEKIHSIDMRSKNKGWRNFGIELKSHTHRIFKARSEDFFMSFFLQNYTIRPSCERCIYKCLPRVSDITIADFWGIEKYDCSFDTGSGVSKVLVNSPKGEKTFDNISIATFAQKMLPLRNSEETMGGKARFPIDRTAFYKKLHKRGLSYAANHHPNKAAKIQFAATLFLAKVKGWIRVKLLGRAGR